MDINRLIYLFQQHDANALSEQEREEMYAIIEDFGNTEALLAYIENAIRDTEPMEMDAAKWKPAIDAIVQPAPVVHIRRRRRTWLAAASLILVLVAVGYWVENKKESAMPVVEQVQEQQPANDIPPGHTGAVLTLSNGQQVVLDSAANGMLAQDGNAQVMKENGQIVYNTASLKTEVVYNTISTPKGRQYKLVLSDGTAVWLNAASSITYPAVFAGKERIVSITGEAYFEVAKTKEKMPFKVKKGAAEVEVLGTHFNVNAYDDEPDMKVTLLEGSVKVSAYAEAPANENASQVVHLQPGEQAAVSPTSIQVKQANVDQAVAWKNGIFFLQDSDIPSIMRQIARWYNVEVVYAGAIPKRHFGGTISRDVHLQNLLQALEINKVHCKLEGRKLIVLP
jgi:Fe2+-dicitrate sensor, membrane component